MAQIVPLGVFKNGFDLVGDAGQPVGGFRGSVWRESGEIVTGGQRYEFRRDGGRRFRLAGPQGGVALARRTGRWSGGWEITAGPATYLLARAGWFSRGYRLVLDGAVVGQIASGRWLSRAGAANLPVGMAPVAQVFVVAIVLTLWRRDDSAGGGAAAGGAMYAGS